MPQFGDWQDLSFDYTEIKKPYRDLATGEVLTAVYNLRDDVPTSVMVRVYGILDLEEDYRKLQQTAAEEPGRKPDYEALAAVEEQREALTLRTLAAIVHHSYPGRAILDLEQTLRQQFTDKERQDLVALFFTRSLVSRQPPSDSTPAPATEPAPATGKKAGATDQGGTRGKSGKSGSGSSKAKGAQKAAR